MFFKRTLTLLLFSLITYSYGATSTELPLINEQQRQLFEELKGLDTKIPSSPYDFASDESEEINVTITDGVAYPIKKIVLQIWASRIACLTRIT